MPSAPFVEIFRYAASGVVFLIYLYLTAPSQAVTVLDDLGAATVAVGALAVGALTYILYRATFFAYIITPLRDLFRPTYRSWLRDAYRPMTRRDAVLLYALARKHMEQGQRPSTERVTHFANVHYGYTASLMTVPFYFVAQLPCGRQPFGVYLLWFGAVLFFATFLFHRRGENEELRELVEFACENGDTLDNLARIVRLLPPAGVRRREGRLRRLLRWLSGLA